MIASSRGVVVLAIIAAILAMLVIVVGPARPSVIDRSIWSGGEPTELTVTHEGEPAVVLVTRGKEWRWREPDIRADAATVDGILTALRAKWHRSGAVSGKRHGSLRVGTTTIEIGEPLAGTEQTWIFRDGRAFLVDNWVARALVPSRLALRVRRPFANIASARSVHVDGFATLEHAHRIAPDPMWLDPAVVQRFYDAADAIEIVALDGTPGTRGLSIIVDGREAVRIGACSGGRVFIKTHDGDGCVDGTAWNALEVAARALRDPNIDSRPVPFVPRSIELEDGVVLGAGAHPTIGPRGEDDADPERVRELVAALQTPGEVVPRSGKPVGKLVIDVTTTLELYKDGVAREGEPLMIRTPLIDIIRRPSTVYRDTTRWREDALTIQSITVDGKTFTRGAVIGEWTGATQPGLVEALAGTLATVRAPDTDKAVRAKHHIAVTFAPPTGQPTTHTVEIGERCAGRIDGAPVMVPLDLCTAASALQ